jgi:protein SCO1/2
LLTRLSAIAASALVLAGLAVAAIFAMQRANADPFADCRRGAVAGGAASIGGPFTLEDTSGAKVSDADVIKGPTLVYFGYSFCPDVCPTDLSRNALAAADLAGKGVKVGQVFVSIDPERDTPQVVGDFVKQIDPAITGLTGTPEEVAAAAKAYKVFYRKAGDDPQYYLMDHSTFTYLVAPGPGFLEFYSSDLSPEEVASSVSCFADKL